MSAKVIGGVVAAFIVATLSLVLLVSCSGYDNERGKGDAPVGQVVDDAWDIVNAPDGYGNVATRCNPYQRGTRLYIVTHGKTDVQPVIIGDESCR